MAEGASPGTVLIMGAGSVGCFIGGKLAAAGLNVRFVGRPRMLAELQQHGLAITELGGARCEVPAAQLQLSDEPVGPADLVLLCVKSGGTRDAALQLAAKLPPGTPVVSMQNGVANAEVGAEAAPGLTWIPGMVPYNIAQLGPGRFHRGTGGQIAAQDHPSLRAWVPAFTAAGLPLKLHADLLPVQWGKLLLNLNNPVNALSGLPLRAQLMDAGYRRALAALQREALDAMAAAGIEPAQVGALPPRRAALVLRLPNWLFFRLAKRMLRIDEKARSSMADDLAQGRPTEVDAICGAVVRLAEAHGLKAPRNARMVELLSLPKPQTLTAAALRKALAR